MTTFAGHTATTRTLSTAELRKLTVHRRAGIFRPLEGDERKRLLASIRNGYDEAHPIVAWSKTNEVIDGRNRRDVAVELRCTDVPVAFVDFPDEDAVTAFVIAQNLARRHLDPKERAELAARLVNGGMSTRSAARVTNVSKDTAQRAASAARSSGVSSETPAKTRRVGADGKSYPATRKSSKPKPTKPIEDVTVFPPGTEAICPTCWGSGRVPVERIGGVTR